MELNFELQSLQRDWDLLKDLKKLKERVKKGDAEALYNLGYFTFVGVTLEEKNDGILSVYKVEQDKDKGLSMIQKAAKLGHVGAIKYLMMLYFHNTDYQDYGKCLQLCKQAQELGSADGYALEALMYRKGAGVDLDVNRAINIYEELNNAGWKLSLLGSAECYADIGNFEKMFQNIQSFYDLGTNYFDYSRIIGCVTSIVRSIADIPLNIYNRLYQMLECIEKNVTSDENFKSNINRVYSEIYQLKARIKFYSRTSDKDLYEAYKFFQLSHKATLKHERRQTDLFDRKIEESKFIYKTEEEKFLEPIVNVGAECPSVAILDEVLDVYDGLPSEWPFAMKRIFIEEFAEKEIFNLISNSKDLLEEGTITNLIGALNGYLQEEILEIEEKQALEKYPNLVAQKRAKVKQEKNYSQYSYQLLSGIERTLKNLFYDRFIDYLEQESLNDANIADFYRNLKTRLKIDQSRNPKESFDLGKFITLVGRSFNDQQQRIIEPNFLKWLKESSGQENEELIVEKLRSIAKRVDFIRDVIRNPIIHGVFAQKWTLVYSLNNALFDGEQNKSLISEVVEVAGFGNKNEVLVEP